MQNIPLFVSAMLLIQFVAVGKGAPGLKTAHLDANSGTVASLKSAVVCSVSKERPGQGDGKNSYFSLKAVGRTHRALVPFKSHFHAVRETLL